MISTRRSRTKGATTIASVVATIGTIAGAMHPSAAAAEAGCDNGEQPGNTYWIPHSAHQTNNHDAWRFYAALEPDGTQDPYSKLTAYNGAGQIIYDARFDEYAGLWSTGHFSELADEETIWNKTGENRRYFYKRSCTK